jgi:HK97 family phage portal protein
VPIPQILSNGPHLNGLAPELVVAGNTGPVEWLYGTQNDLDSAGNTIGVITARDGNGMIARLDMAPASECQVLVRGGRLYKYRIAGDLYDPGQIWHEKAFTVPGLHVGLSPVAYAAWAIGEYLSVQDFATDWFVAGAVPRARLQNTAKTITPKDATIIKESWRASISTGEPFVHGNDWTYDMLQAAEASRDWIDAKKFSITDVARFFGVPADLIDSAATGETRSAITYANISQRNLQFLLMNLGPAIYRREQAISRGMLLQPRYMQFETKALLRLDPATRAEMVKALIEARVMTPDEARFEDDLPALTDEQVLKFYFLFGYPQGGVPAEAPGTAPPPAAAPPGEGDTTGELPAGSQPAAIEPPPK